MAKDFFFPFYFFLGNRYDLTTYNTLQSVIVYLTDEKEKEASTFCKQPDWKKWSKCNCKKYLIRA